MNYLKLQLNSLIFKSLIVSMIAVASIYSSLKAQVVDNFDYISQLYDSTKIYYTTGDYENAIQGLNKILLLKGQINSDLEPKYFKVYNRLGLVNRKKGSLKAAIKFYSKALDHTTDIYHIAIINGNMANIYSILGESTKAISYYENTLSILEKSDEQKKYQYIVDNYHNQGYVYYRFGKYDLAEYNYLKSIKISEANKLEGIGETYYNLGLVFQATKNFNKAEYYFSKAINSYTNEYGTNHYMTAMAYMNYAGIFSDIGDFKRSFELYNKSLKIFNSTLGQKHLYTSYCLKHIGNLFLKNNNYKQAIKFFQASLISKISDFNDRSIYSNPSPNVFPDLDLLDVLNAKSKAFEKQSEKENRKENLKAAINTLELSVFFTEQLRTGYLYESSKLQLAEKEHDTYLSIVRNSYSLYELTGDIKYAEAAFKYSELSKYATLRELINEETARGIAGIPDSIGNMERDAKEQIGGMRMQLAEENKQAKPDKIKIDKLNEKIFGITRQLETIMQELERNYPEYYRQKYINKVVGIASLQNSLDNTEAVLEYVLEDSVLYTFTITKDTFQLLKQDADSIFHSSLKFYTKVLHSEYTSDYYAFRNAAYNLYKKLIYPIESLLANKRILIIPDDKMNLVSFDVLIDKPYKSGDKPYYAKESYLLRKYPMAYAYSATLYYNTLPNIIKGSPNFLGIAPGYENSRDSLRHIPLGLKNVRKLALFTLGKALTGDKASESNFKKYCSKYDIIHFYAHGFEDTLDPANSKLYLSEPVDTLDDGYLHAWEVYNMQLNAKLVALASCYSGSGKLLKGEGVLSISRSFIYAGSESVIMSLWLASDKPTNEILNDFYMNLLKGMRKDDALRLAKLKYLKEIDPIQAHPRFWAGIVINGNQKEIYRYWYLKKLIFILSVFVLIFLLLRKRKLFKKFS